MKRTHVTFEELEFGGITEKVPLEDIKVGEGFITVDTVAAPHEWPVYERTETAYLRRKDGEISAYIPEYYSIHRVKE